MRQNRGEYRRRRRDEGNARRLSVAHREVFKILIGSRSAHRREKHLKLALQIREAEKVRADNPEHGIRD